VANSAGQTASPIIDDLLSKGHEFTFPQVMRLARMQLGAGGKDELPEVPWQERVSVRPDLSFAFPAADVARVEAGNNNFRITATFLGLYGSSSPLPTFYTEDLMDEASADSSVSRDFLDLFHQRLYQLYFQCWSKYRLFIRVAEEKNPLDRERLFCLIGLGEKELRDSVPDAWSLLRYAGLLTQFPRSAEGLRTLLRDALGVLRLKVEQCVLRRVPIPSDQRMSLGISGMSLGKTTVLGSEATDRMGKFRILIGPLKKREFDGFLPGRPLHDKLARLIRIYIIDPFDYDLKLTLAANQAEPIRLGDPSGPRLGWNSWCFAGDTLGEVSSKFPIADSTPKPPATPADDYDSEPEPATLVEYYQQELAQLRELTKGYVEKHTEMAPLVSGHMAAPGVERLFEGTAFLWALLRMKLDDDFPELVNKVMDIVQPDRLQPIPATTIIAFSPKPNCTETQTIPAGTEVISTPVDGTVCRFTTCYPVEIHPLILTEAFFAHPSGKPAAITLRMQLTGIDLSNWNLKSLRLFLASEYSQAANLYLVLMRYVNRITISSLRGGQKAILNASHLTAVGFEETDSLLPFPSSRAVRHQLIHDYFIQPDKFHFIDLCGWDNWQERGEGTEFEIRFDLETLPFVLHQVSKEDFGLFSTPAVNVFKHRAEPIVTNSQQSEYQVRPVEGQFGHHEIYSVDGVNGLLNNTSLKLMLMPYQQGYRQSRPVNTYYVKRRNSAIRKSLDALISIDSPQITSLSQITSLDVDLTCTNGNLPDKLQIGDICRDSDNSPGFAEFTNCKAVTKAEIIGLRSNYLWGLYSHCNINIALLNTNSLRAVLELISQTYNRDYTITQLNTNRIRGISELQIKPADRLLGRSVLRGWEFRIMLNSHCYDSPGDLYLFGILLDHFLRDFATSSCFTMTTIMDVHSGTNYDFPVKMGRRELV